MTIAENIVAVMVLALIVLGGSQVLGPYCGRYTFDGSCIKFILFGSFRAWEVRVGDIEDIQEISVVSLFITPSLHLMNKPFGKYVLVRKKNGIIRNIVITPDDVSAFIGSVRQHITKN